MDRPGFDAWKQQEMPLVEQLEELVGLLRETVHITGRGVKHHVAFRRQEGRIKASVPSGEAFIPGDITDWSIPDSNSVTEIRRFRNIVGLYRTVGAGAAKLVVIETDATRIDMEGEDKYHTLRTSHVFVWNSLRGVYEARKNPVEIVSASAVDAEVLPRQEPFAPDKLMLSVEHTAPLERFDFGWEPVTETDVDGLLYRTQEFQRDKLLALEDDK